MHCWLINYGVYFVCKFSANDLIILIFICSNCLGKVLKMEPWKDSLSWYLISRHSQNLLIVDWLQLPWSWMHFLLILAENGKVTLYPWLVWYCFAYGHTGLISYVAIRKPSRKYWYLQELVSVITIQLFDWEKKGLCCPIEDVLSFSLQYWGCFTVLICILEVIMLLRIK